MLIEQQGREGVYNDMWHTDVTYQQAPPMASILHAQVLPPSGGDTLWSSLCAAYDALSDKMKSLLEGLTALHDFAYSYRSYLIGRPDGKQRLREAEDRYPTAEHPVVRTHPETGRKGLFVNRSFTVAIKDLPQTESDGLLRLLFEHCEMPAFQMRHRWRPRDLVMWDNRCTMHYAVADYFPHHRKMHRVTLRGEPPFFRA
jgi:taurine dioxygenase